VKPKPDPPVKIGLIGCGIWGRKILRDLTAIGCELVVVDPDPVAREKAAAVGATALASLGDVPRVEGFVVATPATTHADMVEVLLGRRVPIFCEKPLTTNPASALRLVESAGDRLFVMHVWRYHRGILRLAELARTEELGPVLSLRTERKNWTSPRTDTDSVWTLVPHDLTIALAVLGGIPEPRHAVVEAVDGKLVGMTALLGRTPFLSIDCSIRFREKRREVRLHCSDGVAVLPDGDSDFIEILREGPGLQPIIERQTLVGEPALRRELRTFVEHLRGGPAPMTDASEGLAVVEAVAALRSLAGVA
jgi:predicted dehydrogenase